MTGKVFIATTGNGLARASQAPGGQWEVDRPLTGTNVCCLAVDPLSPERAYAGTQGQGFLRSDDRGRTWQRVGLAGQIVKAIAASPTRPAVVYAGTKPAGMFISQDAGESWTELDAFRRIPRRWLWFSPAERPYVGYVQSIALSPTDPQRMVGSIEAGATVLSCDGGRSWTGHQRGALRDCHTLTFHATHGEWVYASGGGWGSKGWADWATSAVSRDAGLTWSRGGSGLDRSYGWAVAADPERPDLWYISAAPGAFKAHSENNAQAIIFRNEGAHWRQLAGGLPQPLDHMPYALLTERGGHSFADVCR